MAPTAVCLPNALLKRYSLNEAQHVDGVTSFLLVGSIWLCDPESQEALCPPLVKQVRQIMNKSDVILCPGLNAEVLSPSSRKRCTKMWCIDACIFCGSAETASKAHEIDDRNPAAQVLFGGRGGGGWHFTANPPRGHLLDYTKLKTKEEEEMFTNLRALRADLCGRGLP